MPIIEERSITAGLDRIDQAIALMRARANALPAGADQAARDRAANGIEVARIYQRTRQAKPYGRMRDWFRERNGRLVHTYQVDNGGVWFPGARRVFADRASAVILDESLREYAGWRVVARTDTSLLVANTRGGAILYFDADVLGA